MRYIIGFIMLVCVVVVLCLLYVFDKAAFNRVEQDG